MAKQISRNTRTKPQSEPRLINPPASVDVRPVVEDGKLLMRADVSVSPAEAVDEPECPQEPPIIDETEQRGEIAPPAAKNEHSEPEHVKVEVFTKLRLVSIAEMERFFETCDAYRGNEARPEGGGFNPWV